MEFRLITGVQKLWFYQTIWQFWSTPLLHFAIIKKTAPLCNDRTNCKSLVTDPIFIQGLDRQRWPFFCLPANYDGSFYCQVVFLRLPNNVLFLWFCHKWKKWIQVGQTVIVFKEILPRYHSKVLLISIVDVNTIPEHGISTAVISN